MPSIEELQAEIERLHKKLASCTCPVEAPAPTPMPEPTPTPVPAVAPPTTVSVVAPNPPVAPTQEKKDLMPKLPF